MALVGPYPFLVGPYAFSSPITSMRMTLIQDLFSYGFPASGAVWVI